MCGISGIVNINNNKVDKFEIEEINNLIQHRGPNGEGFYFGENFAFGHRRLSIIDLSEEGSQPMFYDDKYIIIFNGEIYNYIEIKEELQENGINFKTKSDTEVILASYDFWGQDCIKYFNGMWSFCIYDKHKGTLFCSRDRYGVKPFYYTIIDNKFIFGSEIKQLLYFNKDRYANINLMVDYLVGYDEHNINDTFFEGIHKLPASHNLIYDLSNHEFKLEKYYELIVNHNIRKLNLKESLELVEEEFKRSIKIRMRSDVMVGTCLSGGLDSSTIASYASKVYVNSENKFTAIHAKSVDKDTDESEFAKIVADASNIDLIIVEPGEEAFFNVINDIIKIHEEPFSGPSLYMQYFVFKKARQNNCIVMLDGQGGDEVFLGYERYYLATLKYLSLLDKIRLITSITKYTRYSYKQIIALLFFYRFPWIHSFFQKNRAKFIKKEYLKFLSLSEFDANLKNYKNIDFLQKSELFQFVLPQLLKVEDKNSMANSIESRLPFLDYKLIETVYSVNNSYKIQKMWSKYLMRTMIENKLPDSIVWRRKKIGFAAPTDTWLKNKRFFLEEIEKSLILKQILNYIPTSISDGLMWKLYNISVWEREFEVKIKSDKM
jgi:asparagine synthase (glutamine-hydrolysing)